MGLLSFSSSIIIVRMAIKDETKISYMDIDTRIGIWIFHTFNTEIINQMNQWSTYHWIFVSP